MSSHAKGGPDIKDKGGQVFEQDRSDLEYGKAWLAMAELGVTNSQNIRVLSGCGMTALIHVYVVERDDELPQAVDAALSSAFSSDQGVAVLLSHNLIGRKEW